MADGTTFDIDLAVKAEGVQSAADLLDRFAQRLDTASKTAIDAAKSVQAGEVAYKQAETAYDRASKALERINVAMESASGKKLENLIARQGEASKAVSAAKLALDGEATALDKLRDSAASADKQVEALTAAQASAKKATDAQKKSQAEGYAANELLASSLGKLGGPLGAAGQKAFELKGAWDKMSRALGAAGPYAAIAVAVVAIATAVAAVAVAAAAAVVHVAAWAVGLADAARTQGLLAAGIAHSVEGGRELDSAITSLAKRVPQTTDELTSMASELAKSGLRGKELSDTLERNAVAAAKLKFGPEWQSQMTSLEQSQKRLKSGLTSLFSGLKIDALLEQLSVLVGTFDESAASGRAIKVVFESFFQPVVDGATGLVPVLRHAFLQFEILTLKALIAIKPFGSTIVKVGEAFAVVAAIGLAVFAAGVAAVVVVLAQVAAAIVVPIALFAAIAAGAAYAGAKIYEFGSNLVTSVVTGVQSAWTSLTIFASTLVDIFSTISLVDVGARIIDGLVGGITSGASAAFAAVSNVADGVVTAAKNALGIASPSKVFAEIGAFTAQGMTQGIEGSSGSVEAAMTDLVAPPEPSASAPSGKDSGSAAGAITYQITIQAAGGTAEDIAEKVRQVLIDLTEGAAVQLGAVVPT